MLKLENAMLESQALVTHEILAPFGRVVRQSIFSFEIILYIFLYIFSFICISKNYK